MRDRTQTSVDPSSSAARACARPGPDLPAARKPGPARPFGTRTRTAASLIELVVRRSSSIGPAECSALRALPYRDEIVERGRVLCDGPDPSDTCGLLIAGIAFCAHRQSSGDPVGVGFSVPGDFLDLQRLVMPSLDYFVVAQNRCVVRRYELSALRRLLHDHPACLRAFWGLSLAEPRRHRAWIAASATLRTEARIAHVLCELHARLAHVGLVADGRFEMPISQKDLGCLLGYSRSQTNRSVQCLRSRGLISWQTNLVIVHDLEDLEALAHFDHGHT